MDEILDLFLSGAYAPHGYCLLWQPVLIWIHVASDALIALSYFSIPAALITLVRRRGDLEFGWMLALFAIFILACGSTHVMAIWNLWHGDYGLEAAVKVVTALASVPTAIILWTLIPRALTIPSPRELQQANARLAAIVGERDAALARLTTETSQRLRAEEALRQREKIDAVGQLAGGIAHGFNNLLQAIGGNIDLIRQRPDDRGRVARWAANAVKGIDRGVRLTGQLLAFSRTQKLTLIPVDLAQLLPEMCPLVQRSVGPEVEVRIAPCDGPATVRADRTQLELAILNLALNARDAMPEGGVLALAIRSLRVTEPLGDLDPGDYHELVVTDGGAGMTSEVAARAADPFFTTKGLAQATGLGLSTALGMARQSGGTLWLASAPGGGTTVRIVLRAVDHADAPVAAGEAARPTLAAPDRAGRTVLVVDDDDDVRDVIADTLETLGYRCLSFAGGKPALAALGEVRPDLVVLDVAMPEMSGPEVAREVRAIQPGLPIIFVSGYADSAMLDDVLDARSAVLRKPFHADDLARLADGGILS